MNINQRPVYDFELMERMNTFLVISLVLTGVPSIQSGEKSISMLDVLPVTDSGPSAETGTSSDVGEITEAGGRVLPSAISAS
jgi:hypothetical protein